MHAEVTCDASRPELGRFLRATEEIAAGGVVLRERYLTFVAIPSDLPSWKQHVELHKLVETQQACSDIEEGSRTGRWGAGLAAIRASELHAGDKELADSIKADLLAAPGGSFCPRDLDDIVYTACVFDRCSFANPSGMNDELRHDIIFPTICRANHSCSPNAVITPTETPAESSLLALRPIARNAAVEICYFPESFLLRPRHQRLQALQDSWGFECACSRCSSHVDAERVFAARCSLCGWSSFIAERQHWSSATTTLLRCVSCRGALEVGDFMDFMLSEEAKVEAVIGVLDMPDEDLRLPVEDTLACLSAEELQLCLDFAKSHPKHYLAGEVSRRRVAALFSAELYDEAAQVQECFASVAEGILGGTVAGLAIFADIYGRLAFLRCLAGATREAKAALTKVLDNYEFVYGRRPPATVCAAWMEDCKAWQEFLLNASDAS